MANEWGETQLSRIAKLRSGFPFKSSSWVEDGVPVIKIANVKDGRIVADGCGYVSHETAATAREWMTQKGDVLIAMTGYVGEVARVRSGEKYLINQRVGRFDFLDDSPVIPEFFFYYLRQPEVRSLLETMARGSAQPNLSASDAAKLWVPVPPPAEQRAIAHILGKLDEKIELNRKQNETLEAMARTLFKAWFVDFEPVRAKMEGRWQRGQSLPGLPAHLYDLFPDRLIESELGEIPEGWRHSTIGEEVTVCGGSTPSTKEPEFWEGGQHCWATPKDLSALKFPVLLDTDRKITDAGLAKISSGLLPVGTVLLSSRAPIGYLAIAEVPTAINQGFIAMKCDGALPNVFVLPWCRESMDAIVGNANGSTFQEISKSNFRPLRVVVPSDPVLTSFTRSAVSLYRQLAENERESRSLAQLRDTLLPKLISGKLRVPDAERIVGAAV